MASFVPNHREGGASRVTVLAVMHHARVIRTERERQGVDGAKAEAFRNSELPYRGMITALFEARKRR